jgi:hypothetical protein
VPTVKEYPAKNQLEIPGSVIPKLSATISSGERTIPMLVCVMNCPMQTKVMNRTSWMGENVEASDFADGTGSRSSLSAITDCSNVFYRPHALNGRMSRHGVEDLVKFIYPSIVFFGVT